MEAVPPVDESLPEIARIFELDRRLARRVAHARAAGELPLVLAGNCRSCLGTVAGARPAGLGVVWFDAHADFDTTDDNLSGFTDVMGLAILTGTGWRALRETIPGFAPVSEDRVVLGAVRDLESYQRAPGGVGRANPDAAPGGPSLDALLAAIDAVFDRFEVAAVALTAYDPQVDGDGGIAAAARRIAALVARRAVTARER